MKSFIDLIKYFLGFKQMKLMGNSVIQQEIKGQKFETSWHQLGKVLLQTKGGR